MRAMLLAACLIVGPSAWAQGVETSGIGTMPCSEVVKTARVDSTKQRMAGWAYGFITGINVGLLDKYGYQRSMTGVNSDWIAGFAVSYCTKNPSQNFVHAAQDFLKQLPAIKE